MLNCRNPSAVGISSPMGILRLKVKNMGILPEKEPSGIKLAIYLKANMNSKTETFTSPMGS